MERKLEIEVTEQVAALVQNLDSARRERRFCDFTIKVGSQDIPTHKVVLSEGSDYFKGMLSHQMKENASGVAEMEGVDPECMMLCVDYIYTGKVSFPESKVSELFQVAHLLQLTKLCEKLLSHLEERLDADSFFMTRKIATTFGSKRLKELCQRFAMKNFPSVARKKEFKDLEKEYLAFLIGSKENEADESIKCKALLVWANHDGRNREKSFDEIFPKLNFSKMPKAYLRHLVECEALVRDSVSCLRIIVKRTSGFSSVAAEDVSLELKGDAQDSGSNVIAIFDRNSKALEAFNPEENTWNVIKTLSEDFALKDFAAVVVGNEIYVLAYDKTNYKLSYRDPNASWVPLPDRINVSMVQAVSFNDAIYALDDASKDSKSIEKFDLTSSTWSQVSDKPVPGYGSAVVAAGDFIFCIGGFNEDNMNDVIRLDPRDETWATMPPMPTHRFGAAAVHLDAKIYVVGGSQFHSIFPTNECFDTITQTWTTLTGLLNPRHWFQACVVHGKIYAAGGYHSLVVLSDDDDDSIEEYDPSADKWKVVETMTGKYIEASVALKI